MNRHEIAAEFEKKFKAGEIGSCSIKELQEYLEAIADFSSAPAAKYSERSSHIQILNTLISVKIIKKLNDKNSFLTWVVIILAGLSFLASLSQIYFILKPPTKLPDCQAQGINLQKSEALSSKNHPSKAHTSKSQPIKQQNIKPPERKTGQQETFEEESKNPSKSP